MRCRPVDDQSSTSVFALMGYRTVVWLTVLASALGGCSSRASSPARRPPSESATARRQFSLPAVRKSEFRNTGPEAKYVGNDACIECHEDQFASYQQTTHSRALDDVDIASEPPDGEFTHELSGKSYRVYRRENQLRHREFLRDEDGEELVIADYPMRYLIGSGNHSRTYLVDIEGFLFESPITWYTSREAWDMSPGYGDDETQPGFARPVDEACVICHAGQVESVDGSPFRLKIHEQAIGCERCHGPGSLHVDRHRSQANIAGDFDDSIVHPARLPRARQEAICAQCHLATVGEAIVRGRKMADFRPSLYLSDFRVCFQLEAEGDVMTVVGHIEQMRASRCYQESPNMTCTTCHDMHGGGGHAKAGRHSCLACHQPNACGLELAERLQKSSKDDCTTCHMPKSDTDIAHFAFRHHRIGIHRDSSPPERRPSRAGLKKLVPIDSLAHLPEIERNRCLGMAYVKLSEESTVDHPRLYMQRAARILEQVREQGLRDAELEVTLARIYLHLRDDRKAIDLGLSALLSDELSVEMRHDASVTLSYAYANLKEFALARPFLEKMSRFRYVADDQLLLSICRQRAGDLAGGLQAARRAVDIEPDRPGLHDAVAELYLADGNREKSKWHQQRSQQLRRLLRVVRGVGGVQQSIRQSVR